MSSNLSEIGFKYSFSSNLLNALFEVGYQTDTIKEMWNELYDATEFRLPILQEIDWNNILLEDLNMNIEEILICILFTRFKSNTTERHHWTLSGIVYLYKLYPEKMIKPTRWFLKNNKQFLKANLLIILEILYDINNEDSEYYKNFEEELNKLYPSNYYLIDFIISKLLSKSKTTLFSGPSILLPVSQSEVDYFKNLNYRNEILYNKDYTFEAVVGKYKATFRRKYDKKFEYLGNMSIEKYVKNIYSANYLLELINGELYDQFSEYYNHAELYDFLQIHYKAIAAQTNSYSQRPFDLEKPHSITNNWQKSELEYSDWIRLAYYESEIYEESTRNNKTNRFYEGIVFKNDLEETIPFSRYRLYPVHIWDNMPMNDFDEFLCLPFFQRYDDLEDYKILWINSILMNELKLNVQDPINGLNAINSKNEVVLRYNRWSSDYVGIGDRASISDEIPRLEGAELICRKDYFEEICKFFKGEKPYLYRLKL